MSETKYTPDFATIIKNRARDTGECPIFDFCERKECRGCVVSKWLNGEDEIPAADVVPTATVEEAVDKAFGILDTIYSAGTMKWNDYSELFDAICDIKEVLCEERASEGEGSN